MERIGIMMACCLFFTGCSLYKVSKEEGSGIPILVKQPVRYQTTQVAMTHWKVSFVLKSGGKEFSAPSGGMEVVASDRALQALEQIGNALSNEPGITPGNFSALVEQHLQVSKAHWGGCTHDEPSGVICIRPSIHHGRTIENKVVVVSELSESQHYINTRRPWIGTASATIELAPDGTMTKAQSEVEDKTVETILSVLPITSFFTRQWNLGESDAAAAAIAPSDSNLRQASSALRQPRPKIELKLEPVTWTYVLRRRLGANDAIGTALTYPDGNCGTPTKYCVQLVSAASASADKAPEEKKPAGWTISGSLTPPAKE